MSKSIWWWIFLLSGVCALLAFICCRFMCGVAGGEDTTKAVIAPVTKAAAVWNVRDGATFNDGVDEHWRFGTSKFSHMTPLSQDMQTSMAATAAYLKDNPERSLTITGYYQENETNNSILPNLGLARANDINKFMRGLGVPAKQLNNAARIVGVNTIKSGVLTKGAEFSFDALASGDDRLAAIKSRLFGKPITLYFGTNQDNISLTAQQRTDFSDLIYYLDNVSTSKLEISGHTDGTGNRDANVALSQSRAKFVDDYLSRNGGINTSRTSTIGHGPDKPIGSNSTNEGRAKNRRVEVTLQ